MALALLLLLLSSLHSVLSLSCTQKCGDTLVPYPFTISSNTFSCGLPQFELSCIDNVLSLRTPSGAFEVFNITSTSLVINSTGLRAESCKGNFATATFSLDSSSPYIISGNNDFFLTGCDSTGNYTTEISSEKAPTCQTGCHSNNTNSRYPFCLSDCCVQPVPPGARTISITSITSHNDTCSFSSVVLPSSYSSQLKTYGLELLWFIPGNKCEEVNACSRNAKCTNVTVSHEVGYNCQCQEGYVGDGYLNGTGCSMVDHCRYAKCASKAHCINDLTSYHCKCPSIYHGDGTLNGGCHLKGYVYLVPVAVGLAGAILLAFCIWRMKKRRNKGFLLVSRNKNLRDLESMFQQNAKFFTWAEIQRATKCFREDLKLGTGGFGTVYKGTLDDNTVVAIKKANNSTAPSIQQFLNEITILSKVNHKNLVKLLGCCIQTDVPILVYEFIPKGTLYEHLQLKGGELTWETRLRIAIETSEALLYLHTAATPPIVHRDVKSSNILLDEDFTAKVADFGISKLVLPVGSTHISTALHGTPGYIDPQYQQNYQLTDKSDVYSFGVVLLELITGQMPVDFSRNSVDKNLSTYALAFLKENRVCDIIDPRLNADDVKVIGSMRRVAQLAEACLEFDRKNRPNMRKVVEQLREAMNTLVGEDNDIVLFKF